MKQFINLTIFLILLIIFFPLPILSSETYPRLANYYLKWIISKEEADQLAKWDVLILDIENQENNPEIFSYLRKKNPDIKILAYVTSEEVTTAVWKKRQPWSKMRNKLYQGIQDSWWLRDPKGNHVFYWINPIAWMLNMNSGWSTHLADFMHQEVMSSGLWDGIFYDVIFEKISWINNGEIDINNDGIKDPAYLVDSEWQKGVIKLLARSRKLEGPDKIILANSLSKYYDQYLNGRMFENFPFRSWQEEIGDYQNLKNGYQPSLKIINSNTNNKGDWNNFPKFRFGLASALMGDGYYSFDYGDQSHQQLWWYDEYEIGLGKAKSEAYDIFEKNNKEFKESVWRRDFEHGLALVNSTSEEKTVDLEGEYEKIKGTQDTKINNGAIVSKVKLAGKDGLILLRPIEKMIGSVFTNGSFARVFNGRGRNIRNGFFAYEKDFQGGKDIIIKDLDGDGRREIVVTSRNKIEIHNKLNKKIISFHPYASNYDKDINIAVGDLNGDGKMEIVTGPSQGGGPHVRIFEISNNQRDPSASGLGMTLKGQFFAYDRNFRGGVNVAVGDLDGDGKAEIITGAGFSGGPHVRIFNGRGQLINPGFFAYDRNFRGGVNVAVGDLDGDGKAEIITGAGFSGGPQIRIFNNQGRLIHPGFFAFNPQNRNGVKVAVNDLDNNGKAEIIGMTTSVFTTALLK